MVRRTFIVQSVTSGRISFMKFIKVDLSVLDSSTRVRKFNDFFVNFSSKYRNWRYFIEKLVLFKKKYATGLRLWSNVPSVLEEELERERILVFF